MGEYHHLPLPLLLLFLLLQCVGVKDFRPSDRLARRSRVDLWRVGAKKARRYRKCISMLDTSTSIRQILQETSWMVR